MEKEFEIAGAVSVPDELSYDEFWNKFIKFIEFIESNDWLFGGGINEIIDGYYINSDGTRGKYVLDD